MVRDLDVIVLGAGGITGRRVAAHLAAHASSAGIRWAAAGRNAERLANALAAVGVEAPEIIVVDAASTASVAGAARRARVVLDLVGPYSRTAATVIDACIVAGTHRLDLTGEIPFTRRMLEEYDRPARAAGVAVVPMCGFESLPVDLAIAALAEESDGLAEVDVEMRIDHVPWPPHPSDLVSGGTVQSLIESLADERAGLIPDAAALIVEPDDAAAVRRHSPIRIGPRLAGGSVLAPLFPGPFINPAVVHRSAHLRSVAAGRPLAPFRYREGICIPGPRVAVPARFGAAATVAGPQALFRAVASLPGGARRATASALSAILPRSGEGPTGGRQTEYRWSMTVRATDRARRRRHLEIEGDGHPGYVTTATMLAEADIAIALDGPQVPGGYHTPSTALGHQDLARFARGGLRFGPIR